MKSPFREIIKDLKFDLCTHPDINGKLWNAATWNAIFKIERHAAKHSKKKK